MSFGWKRLDESARHFEKALTLMEPDTTSGALLISCCTAMAYGAMLIDPDNMNARYNYACTMANLLKDPDAALGLLGPLFESMGETTGIALLKHAQADPDLDTLRDDPRFKAMVAAAEARLRVASDARAAVASLTSRSN